MENWLLLAFEFRENRASAHPIYRCESGRVFSPGVLAIVVALEAYCALRGTKPGPIWSAIVCVVATKALRKVINHGIWRGVDPVLIIYLRFEFMAG